VLLVYDVTKSSSFSNIKTWVEELREHASPHIVAMLVGNKSDLGALRVIPAEVAAEFASAFPPDPFSGLNSVAESSPALLHHRLFCTEENGMMYIETSALDTSNVESAFESVLSEICRKKSSKHIEPKQSSSGRPARMIERHFFDI
jgi:Ras-related protein Rab-11A